MWSTFFAKLGAILLFISSALAAPTCNIASHRQCWTSTTGITTDYETTTPTTGITRSYTLTLTEVDNWVGGDGRIKTKAMLINGQFPGPVLRGDWGDKFSVTVINQLRTNGTSIHWHGMRMLNNNINDGVNGVTECPIPPGKSKVYTFLAEQYGTTWYHSHFSSQYANGVVGSIQINGPTSNNWDIDLGVYPITDYYLKPADTISEALLQGVGGGAPPPADNVLFNGTNINPAGSGGAYNKVKLTPNKRHLLRLINPSVDNTFTVSLVNHQMTIVASDLVPVQSFTTSSLYMAVGQRYDVLIDASQAVGNYWFNVTYSGTGVCGTGLNPKPASIFSYVGAPNANPTIAGTAPPDSLCHDNYGLVPVVTRTAPIAQFTPAAQNLDVQLAATANSVRWTVNGSTMSVDWSKPTLEYVQTGNTSYPASENLIRLPTADIWSFWVIQNGSPIPHPMHLHGHDFLVLGRSTPLSNPFAGSPRPFNPSTDTSGLQTSNPIRRDVTMLPAFGWLIVAFKTDNPGAWLFHCHIAWHAAQGLSVQFLERASEIPGAMNLQSVQPNCVNWRAYAPSNPFLPKTDSGLRIRGRDVGMPASLM